MKIYTRAGDKGRTQIIGHQVVQKDDARVEAYGTTDELNSWVGYIISTLTPQTSSLANELEEIQQLLFDVGNDLPIPLQNHTENINLIRKRPQRQLNGLKKKNWRLHQYRSKS